VRERDLLICFRLLSVALDIPCFRVYRLLLIEDVFPYAIQRVVSHHRISFSLMILCSTTMG
jgi:hypothetical protein